MKSLLLLLLCLYSYTLEAQQWDQVITFDTGCVWGNSLSMRVRGCIEPYNNRIILDSNKTGGGWKVAIPHKKVLTSSWSSPKAIITYPETACPPNDTSTFIVKFPKRDFFNLFFRYRLDMDTGDKAIVEISEDSGAIWKDILSNVNSFFPHGMPSFKQSTPGWDSVYMLYNEFNWASLDSMFSLRFTFITDSQTNVRDGWMLDDFSTEYYVEGIPTLKAGRAFMLYPNPAHESINLSFSNIMHGDCQLIISDIFGQTRYSKTLNASVPAIKLDLLDFPRGLYFVTIYDSEERYVQTIVIN